MTIIPVSADYRQELDVRLDGELARFVLWWQPGPDGHWYVSMERPVRNVLVRGRRVVPGVRLLPRRYEPNLYCEPLADVEATAVPGLEPWGRTHRLVWK